MFSAATQALIDAAFTARDAATAAIAQSKSDSDAAVAAQQTATASAQTAASDVTAAQTATQQAIVAITAELEAGLPLSMAARALARLAGSGGHA